MLTLSISSRFSAPRMRPLPLPLALAALVTLVPTANTAAAGAERRAVIFYTGEIKGVVEPCGCTSNPLGDIARMTGLVKEAQKQGNQVLVVDAGNLLFAKGELSARQRPAALHKANFLAAQLAKLPFGGAALGVSDLAAGPNNVRPMRLASNVKGASFATGGHIETVGGIRIGVFGIADPEIAAWGKFQIEDPVAAAQHEAARLRQQGAEIVIALAALERPRARQIAQAAAVDFLVVGKGVGQGLERAETIGNAHLVAPGHELERLGRIDVVLRDGKAGSRRILIADGGGQKATTLRRIEIDQRLRALDADLTRWQRDPNADSAFVAGKVRERDELKTARADLERPWTPPATGSYFTNQLIPLHRALPRDAGLAAALRQLDVAVGKANLAQAQPPPKAEPGRATFVGDQQCARCHKASLAFWKTTVHAGAWKTLVRDGKTGHEDCVSCHVTGFGEVGGSSLGFVKGLTSVQCEVCHGPGSLHVRAEGLEDPPAVALHTQSSTCTHCHTEEHSDTFSYEAYLRDILGPGHGRAAREKLGPGATGHELRQAALTKARAAGAAQMGK